MKESAFVFEMRQVVRMQESEETGTVIGRSEYATSENSYLIRYMAGDGRQTEAWWSEGALRPF